MRDVRTMLARLRDAARGENPAGRTRLADVGPDAVVTIAARVVQGAPSVTSPFTNEVGVCVRVRCLAKATHRTGEIGSTTGWDLLSDDILGERFQVEDGTGCAGVIVSGAEIIADETDVSAVANTRAEKPVLQYLRERRLPVGLRILHSFLRAGDVVEVCGRVSFESEDGTHYRSAAKPLIVFRSEASSGATLRIRRLA